MVKLQRWRGFQSIFGLEAAPVLEFGNKTVWAKNRNSVRLDSPEKHRCHFEPGFIG